jgi:hypothetical protein
MDNECGQKHAPADCEAFMSKTAQERVEIIKRRELCPLCFRHLEARECWSKGKVPNCGINECNKPHHPALHVQTTRGHAMVVLAKGPGEEKEQNHLCREKVKIEVAGRAQRLHAMHNWGTSVTLRGKPRRFGADPTLGQNSSRSGWERRRIHMLLRRASGGPR